MIRPFKRILFLRIFPALFFCSGLIASEPKSIPPNQSVHDTITDRQVLFNGRIWKSRYGQILGNEFFLTKEWIRGEVVINKKTFRNVMLRYDLLNDQLLARVNPGTVIILSNEKIERFTLLNGSGKYLFVNYDSSGSSTLRGYGNLLYEGKTSLIVKYIKQIKVLAVENKYDEFYQKQQLYLNKDGMIFRIRTKKDLFSQLADHREEIQKFIKDNKTDITISEPETIIPVLMYYDTLILTR